MPEAHRVMTERWTDGNPALSEHIAREAANTLAAYRSQPNLIREHVGIEDEVLGGGYGHRQIHELIQNAADAILEARIRGVVHVILTEHALYCANEGAPIDADGVTAILHSHISTKRGDQIGQFGLGFKSVLAVSRTPEIYSRSVSFGFDEEWSRDEIRRVEPSVARTPVLRLARLLDSNETALTDPVFAALMPWASTIVKLPRNIERPSAALAKDLEEFPAEFLLFSPHVASLRIEDRTTGLSRLVRTDVDGGLVTIHADDVSEQWRIMQTAVPTATLAPDALEDAGKKTRDRTTLPVLWAVPKQPGRSRGRFWAFFSTQTVTSLRGILNAPWKTNSDRQNLLDGPLNRKLIRAAANLVAQSLPTLLRAEEPGQILDFLPARLEADATWAESELVQQLESILGGSLCLPDANGVLQVPTALRLRPEAVVSSAANEAWPVQPEHEGSGWVHHSVETRERRAKAERLGVGKSCIVEWLESLAQDGSAESCIRALAVVNLLRKSLAPAEASEMRRARIVLTQSGNRVTATHPGLFVSTTAVPADDAVRATHVDLAGAPGALDVLLWLGVSAANSVAKLGEILRHGNVDWNRVWELCRDLSIDQAMTVFRKHSWQTPNVMTGTGEFSPILWCLLPGPIVSLSTDRDASVRIDADFHREELSLLRRLGATEVPAPGYDMRRTLWYNEYLQEAKERLISSIPAGSPRPYSGYLSFQLDETVGPLDPLLLLSDDGRVAMTLALMPFARSDSAWDFGHNTRRNVYPVIQCEPPSRWVVRHYGRLATSLGPTAVDECVSGALAMWSDILPVLTAPVSDFAPFAFPECLEELAETHWQAALARLAESERDCNAGGFYAQACSMQPAPKSIQARVGGVYEPASPAAVWLATDDATLDALVASGQPVLRVPTEADASRLIARWGLRRAEATIAYTPIGETVPVADMFPALQTYAPSHFWSVLLQACSEITRCVNLESETRTIPLSFGRIDDGVIGHAADLPRSALLRAVCGELELTFSDDQIAAILEQNRWYERESVYDLVRQEETVQNKLAALFPPEVMLARLPTSIQTELSARGVTADGHAVAQMTLAVFGVEVLKEFSADLAAKGLFPPTRWNGGTRAQEFVDELGFPLDFAGFERTRRDPAVDVDGPIVLNPLHDFQQEIAERIRAFLRADPPDRGLVSLPTGAGKTRVVVEALIRAFNDGELTGTLVWIAQSDELCEQAVQAWAQVWRTLGPNSRLRISRLWGETNNRVVALADTPHVVIATYQTLTARLGAPAYSWLRKAECIVIDEAHGAIAPSYTAILEQFGLTWQTTARPLIGLTATPFRGSRNEEETQRLVNRFGANRFDVGVIPGDDPYPILQERGILARVDHELLDGATLSLSADELGHLEIFHELPRSAEARLGANRERSQRIVDSVRRLPADWPVLIFGTSVDQSKLLAALLSIAGIPTQVISGETEPGARRHYVEEFKRGRVRALTNYGVLTTGFDAPAVRALYVARPVFSPVLYQQMIGRGLRGPANGGKDRCLVVNIADNIAQYGHQLAFKHFAHLWNA